LWILVTTILASGMAFIDGTSTNLALPAIQVQLNASATDLQWVVQAYTLFLSALILVGGALGDRFGRKRVFQIGVLLFTGASIWCGLAVSIGQLITARAFQGIGAALLIPGSLSIISAAFSPQKRGKAIGTWSGFSALTTALGPVVGGWLIEHLSWRWVFYTNVPLAIAVLLLSWRFVPESRDESSIGAPLDLSGALLITIGLGGVVYGLTESATRGFDNPLVIVALVLGISAIGGFILVEHRAAVPLMPLHLFRSRTFAGANLLTLLLYAALGGSLYFFPLNLIQVQGYTATESGLALLPFVLVMFVLSRWSGGLVARFGARRPLTIGPIVVACGFLLFAVPGVGGSYWTTFFPAVLVMSLGMAISVAPLTTTVMNAIEQSHAGVASGINNAVSRTAGLLAISVMGIVMLGTFGPALTTQLAALELSPAVLDNVAAQQDRLAGIALPDTVTEATAAQIEQAVHESFVAGYRMVMYLACGLALASAASAALMIRDYHVFDEPTSAFDTTA
jgi:EmrB/QacA subfamily drug resistance transporter